MNITRFSIQKPIAITMIVMLVVVLGLYSFYRIGVELLPAINTPYVTVTVNYPGASSEQVEQDVIKPLENSLSSLSNLKHMTSNAMPEKGTISLEFEFWANADICAIDATKYVNAVRSTLPTGIKEPVVIKRDLNATPIMEVSVLADKPLGEVYATANNIFVEKLQRASGVSDIQIDGGRDKEVAVDVDKNKLSYFNISLNQIVTRIQKENMLTPSGSVFGNNKETNVRLTAQYTDPTEMGNIYITSMNGHAVPLKNLATIREQDARVSRYARSNGQDVVFLSIYKNSNANLVDTVKAAKAELDSLRVQHPDYQFVVITDASQYVKNSLNNTLEALIEGLCTTSLVLYFFLRGWRSMVTVLVAIPTSLISTFFVMYFAGFTFNMMSLMGMSLCIGILVDDSIVVLENIHRHMRMGKAPQKAAEEGRTEIGMAAIAITLCDVVVFMPIAFMNGMTGQYFRQFGLTIVFAALFSMFVSFTLTPMLASRLFKNGLHEPQGPIWDGMNHLETKTVDCYEKLLRWSLNHGKKLVAMGLLCFFAVVSLIPIGIIGSEYMPKTDEGSFRITIQMPVGTDIDLTNKKIKQIEDYIGTIPEVTNYLSSVGSQGGNNGSLSVQMIDQRNRTRSVWQITDQVRNFLKQEIPEANAQVSETSSSIAGISGGGGHPIQIGLYSPDLSHLVKASYQVQQALTKVNGVKDVVSSYTEGMPEMRLIPNRKKLQFYKTSVDDINNVFTGAIAGAQAGYFPNDPQNNGQDTNIYVRLKGSDGFKTSDIRSIPVQTTNGLVTLGSVAEIKDAIGPVRLRRFDKQESVEIQANVTNRPLQDVLNDIDKELQSTDLGPDVTYEFTGQANNMHDTFAEMAQALGLSLVLVYMVLAILYESFSTPIIRMFSLPLGLIGSLSLLAITHNTINLYSLIGILVMDGVVAKNGTLLLDYTLTLQKQGFSAKDAIIEAGKNRLRPIFMTTLTMIVGMLPTALAMTAGSETRVSMAWVIIGGLLSSTVFTLLIIPIIFLYFESRPIPRYFHRVMKFMKKIQGNMPTGQ